MAQTNQPSGRVRQPWCYVVGVRARTLNGVVILKLLRRCQGSERSEYAKSRGVSVLRIRTRVVLLGYVAARDLFERRFAQRDSKPARGDYVAVDVALVGIRQVQRRWRYRQCLRLHRSMSFRQARLPSSYGESRRLP